MNPRYEVRWGNRNSNGTKSLNNRLTTLDGLAPGTMYTFEFITHFPDVYSRPDKTVTFARSITTLKTHGQTCNKNHEECQHPLHCLTRYRRISYCLCDDKHFWHQRSCMSATMLAVVINNVTMTSTNVTFKWSADTYGLNTSYEMYYGRQKNHIFSSLKRDSAPFTARGLSPGRNYTFQFVTRYSKDRSYSRQKQTSIFRTITTPKAHKQRCVVNDRECQYPLRCLKGRVSYNHYYCLCDDEHFWYSSNGSCVAVDGIKIEIDILNKTINSITFEWSSQLIYGAHYFRLKRSTSDVYSVRYPLSSPSIINRLIPGDEYTFEFFTCLKENYYYEQRRVPTSLTLTMLPAQPGPVDLINSQLSSNPMLIVFGKQEGKIDKYKIILRSMAQSDESITEETFGTKVQLNLQNEATYNYTIFAYNKDNEVSVPRHGQFKTLAKASSPVTDLQISSITLRNVSFTWGMPEHPNGRLSGFVFQIRKENAPQAPVYEAQGDFSFFSMDAQRNAGLFSHQATSLSPDTKYTVLVFAINAAGAGNESSLKFQTSKDCAKNIAYVNATAGKNNKTLQLYIDVVMIPGERTGETNYSVTLVDPKNVKKYIKNLTGYSNTSVIFTDLLANHKYFVSAYAQTYVGRSPDNTTSNNVTTFVNKPGKAMNVTVRCDEIIATKFVLTLDCPSEEERNGTIESVTVYKRSLNYSAAPELYNFAMPEECSLTVNSTNLGVFNVSHKYSFTVILKNEHFASDQTHPISFYAAAKPPIFEKSVELIGNLADGARSPSTVQITVCIPCLLDERQGLVTDYGVIVCVKSKQNLCNENKKTIASNKGSLDQFATWAAAKAVGFNIPYKVSLGDWLPGQSDDVFTIGFQSDCREEPSIKEFCNGPLPDGRKVIITAFSCTKGGCGQSEPFITKTTPLNARFGVGQLAAIAAGAGVICFIVVAVIMIFILRRRKRLQNTKVVETQRNDAEGNEVITGLIPIRKLKEVVAQLKKDSNMMFREEFEHIKVLSSEVGATTQEAKKETNKAKNRYADILPYDHSRVKLQMQPESDNSSDYINASYIPGFNSDTDYIATQGPMQATVPHLWRMVWEQGTTAIVMLSGLTENNKLKVSLYWPEILNEPMTYGEIIVEMVKFFQTNNTVVRTFRISLADHSRLVTHFFLQGWSDFSANLTSNDAIEFVQLVRTKVTDGGSWAPIVVHCSAGVGRTGTFIALDYFMQYIEQKGLDADIDIFGYVMRMRQNRPRMVQAESQYVFIYDTLLEVIERKLKDEQAEQEYNNTTTQEECLYANTTPNVEEQAYANVGSVINEDPI